MPLRAVKPATSGVVDCRPCFFENSGVIFRDAVPADHPDQMPTSFSDIEFSFEFVSSEGVGTKEAFLCRRTGKIYWRSDFADLDELRDEAPDDADDEEKYIAIPNRQDLGLGKPLALDFAREVLPDDFDEVRYMFSKRGAYKQFRALMTRRNVLDRWYEFEAKATERALREWCELNPVEPAD
jgi:hypothetical protein